MSKYDYTKKGCRLQNVFSYALENHEKKDLIRRKWIQEARIEESFGFWCIFLPSLTVHLVTRFRFFAQNTLSSNSQDRPRQNPGLIQVYLELIVAFFFHGKYIFYYYLEMLWLPTSKIFQGLMWCFVFTQIVNRLSLLARESHTILKRQIETCMLQPADFKVWINSEAVLFSDNTWSDFLLPCWRCGEIICSFTSCTPLIRCTPHVYSVLSQEGRNRDPAEVEEIDLAWIWVEVFVQEFEINF